MTQGETETKRKGGVVHENANAATDRGGVGRTGSKSQLMKRKCPS